MMEKTLERRGRRLLKGGGDDEDIHSLNPSPTHDDDHQVAAKKKSNDEIRIGPITRARAKLIEQQVNSLLVEYAIYSNESFLLPKSLHICMIRYSEQPEDPRAEGEDKDRGANFLSSPELPAPSRNFRPPRNFRPQASKAEPSVQSLC
jgi:hypothetical protein